MDHLAVSMWRRVAEYLRKIDTGFLATAMSPRWFFMDFYAYPPLILLALLVAFEGGWAQGVGLVGVGVVAWTLAEYLIHRFGFHHVPWLKTVHLEHHADPAGLHGSPTLVTMLVFGGLVFAPLWGVAGLVPAAGLTAGVMLGYLAYVAVHYVVHHAASLGPGWMRGQMRALIRAHAVHHHQVRYNFGVTTTLWDRVFGTLHRR